MAILHSESRLERAPGLRLRLSGRGRLTIELRDGNTLHVGDRALEVLIAFARPATLQEGVKRLTPRAAGAAEWIELMEMVRELAQGGALVVDGAPAPKIHAGGQTFGGAPVHIRMLDDRVRTSRWIAAIETVVRAGDVVVDVGTGTGVLAIAAARAGAKHVYAIESGDMAPVAREVIRSNGFADRVTVVEGWSTEVTLPERGDVFVSETIGNLAFNENLIGIARDAVRRHLEPGARMIPQNLRLCALPVQAPAEWTRRQLFAPAATRNWREWYGIDFDVLNALPVDYGARGLRRPNHASWPVLGDPVPLGHAAFAETVTAELEVNALATLTGAGDLNAFILFFESRLAPGVNLSTDPRLPEAEFPQNWQTPVWLIPPMNVLPGERVRVAFSWQERGPHRLDVSRVAKQP